MKDKRIYQKRLSKFKDYEINELKKITDQQQETMFKLECFMSSQDLLLTRAACIMSEQDKELHEMEELIKEQNHAVKRFLKEYEKLHLENVTERKLINAVIDMRENMKKECCWFEKQGETDSKGYESLQMYKEDCTEILEEIGNVEISTENLGQEYNPEIHEIIETIPISGEAIDCDTKKICKIYSDGYRWKDEHRRIKVGVGVYQ